LAIVESVEDVEVEEEVVKGQLIVHKLAVDGSSVKKIVNREKGRFFSKLVFLKPKPEEVESESIDLYYEPYIVADASYMIDYYRKNNYRLKVDDKVSEVVVFGEVLKPEEVKKIMGSSYKELSIPVEERIIKRVSSRMAMNRNEREIDALKLPSGEVEPDPKQFLDKQGNRVRETKFPLDDVVDVVRKKLVKRPEDVGRVVKEVFKVTELVLIYTPVYEVRCRYLKTGEIKIIPISGVTGEVLSI